MAESPYRMTYRATAAEPAAGAQQDKPERIVWRDRKGPNWAIVGVFVILAFHALHAARVVFVPVFAAIILYLMVAPLLRAMHRRRVPNLLSATIVIAAIAVAAILAAYSLAAPATEWWQRFPLLTTQIEERLELFREPVEDVKEASEEVERLTNVTEEGQLQVAVSRPSLFERLFGTAMQIAVQLTVMMLLLFFLMVSGGLSRERMATVVRRPGQRRRALALTRRVERDVSNYLATVTVINATLGALIGLGLFLIGLPNPVLWGTMAMILNYVPYAGSLVGIAVVGAVSFVSFEGLGHALAAPLFYAACTTLEGNVVTPLVLGRRLIMNPFALFASVLFWGWLWGVPGALLAVPLLVAFKAYCENVERLRPIAAFLGRPASSRREGVAT